MLDEETRLEAPLHDQVQVLLWLHLLLQEWVTRAGRQAHVVRNLARRRDLNDPAHRHRRTKRLRPLRPKTTSFNGETPSSKAPRKAEGTPQGEGPIRLPQNERRNPNDTLAVPPPVNGREVNPRSISGTVSTRPAPPEREIAQDGHGPGPGHADRPTERSDREASAVNVVRAAPAIESCLTSDAFDAEAEPERDPVPPRQRVAHVRLERQREAIRGPLDVGRREHAQIEPVLRTMPVAEPQTPAVASEQER